jgi:hypothetical protein
MTGVLCSTDSAEKIFVANVFCQFNQATIRTTIANDTTIAQPRSVVARCSALVCPLYDGLKPMIAASCKGFPEYIDALTLPAIVRH